MTTCMSRWIGRVTAVLAGLVAAVALSHAASAQGAVEIPPNATALEGIPQVRIDVTEDSVTRRQLDTSEAAKERLTIKIVDGRLYRVGGDNQPLVVTSLQEFTYLSSSEPGNYVRLRRLGNRITYVEHMDMPFGSVTYSGYLRIELGK